MKLRKVEEWTRGKLQFPALASAYLVVNADRFYGAMKLLTHATKNKHKLYGSKEWIAWHKQYVALFRCEDIDAWSRLYRRLFVEFPAVNVLGTIPAFAGLSMIQALPALTTGLESLTGLDGLNRPPVTDWIRTYLLEDFNVAEDELSAEERLRSLAPLAELPFMLFSVKIFIPCIVYYRSSPATLMKRALAGHMDSFASLLSLDKNLLHVPEFYAIWEPISRDPESALFKRLTAAMNRSPHRGLTPMRVKTVIAVAIEALFDGMGQPISRPDIRALFDAYARDAANTLLDEDLPGTDDGFDAAIRREKSAWARALAETA